jgi:hypothetical protein
VAPGILSLARLSMSFRISAEWEGVILVACGQRFLMTWQLSWFSSRQLQGL